MLGGGLAVAAATLGRVPRGWKVAAGWTGFLAIAASAVTFSSGTPFPGYAALLPTIGAALVICAGMTDTHDRAAVATLLDRAPMRFVGDRSYAFYLWHWPVLIIAEQYVGHELPLAVNLPLAAHSRSRSSRTQSSKTRCGMTWTRARSGLAFGTAAAAVALTAVLSIGALQEREERFRVAASPEPQFAVAE